MKFGQLCLTLCDPTDSTAHEILEARILEWVALSFSRGSSQPRDQTQVSQADSYWEVEVYFRYIFEEVLIHLGTGLSIP